MANDAPTGKAPDAPGRAGSAGTDTPRDLEPMSPADAKQPPPLGPNKYEAVLNTAPAVSMPARPANTPAITDACWADTDTPLGGRFAPGVFDPHNTLQGKRPGIARKEQAIAQLEADGGAAVHFLGDSPVDGERYPDVRTRRGPDQPARLTDYTTLESSTWRAVYRSLRSTQIPGDAVVDGRTVKLTRESADTGYNRAARSSPVPENVYFYLGDGTVHMRTRGS
jgi:hypothetical protein